MNLVISELQLEAMRIFVPQEDISVIDFLEREIYLPEKVAQKSGPLSADDCRYIDECAEDFRDDEVTDSCLCFGAQLYKTTIMIGGVCYKIVKRRGNTLWIMPNEHLAQAFSEGKFQPIVEASPAVAERKPKNADQYKKLEMHFGSMIFTLIGAGSKKNLKSRSVEVVVIDEADDVEEEWAKRGESAIAMAHSRTKSYAGSKRMITGTPTVPDAPVWKNFLAGDQRLRFVECPHCKGEPFTLEFDPSYVKDWFPNVNMAKVVWNQDAKNEDGSWNMDAVELSAHYECPNCKGTIEQMHIQEMEAKAKWIPQKLDAPRGYRSRRLPSMYSPHASCAVGKIAVKFLKYQDMPGGLRNFINEELALPWQAKATTVLKSDIQAIVQHSPDYLIGQIPKNNLAAMILTIDVQVDSFWWVIRAWFGDKSSALIDYGQTFSYEDLVLRSNKKYPMLDGREAACAFCLIDSGFRAKREEGIYKFCIDQGGRFFPTKGATEGQGMIKSVMETDVEFHGTPLKLLRFSDPIFQYALSVERIKQRAKMNWFLPRNIGRDYERQLSSMKLVEKKNPRGLTDHQWEAVEDNHLNDCEKQQLIMPAILEEVNGLAALAEKMKPIYGKVTAAN